MKTLEIYYSTTSNSSSSQPSQSSNHYWWLSKFRGFFFSVYKVVIKDSLQLDSVVCRTSLLLPTCPQECGIHGLLLSCLELKLEVMFRPGNDEFEEVEEAKETLVLLPNCAPLYITRDPRNQVHPFSSAPCHAIQYVQNLKYHPCIFNLYNPQIFIR